MTQGAPVVCDLGMVAKLLAVAGEFQAQGWTIDRISQAGLSAHMAVRSGVPIAQVEIVHLAEEERVRSDEPWVCRVTATMYSSELAACVAAAQVALNSVAKTGRSA